MGRNTHQQLQSIKMHFARKQIYNWIFVVIVGGGGFACKVEYAEEKMSLVFFFQFHRFLYLGFCIMAVSILQPQMCQKPWLDHSGWIISKIKCLLSSTPANTVPSCFANVRGADTCFDFDLVNRNCSSGRSWSKSGQQGDVAQASPETHIYLGAPLFSVVPPVALVAAACAGSAVAGQSWTWHRASRRRNL